MGWLIDDFLHNLAFKKLYFIVVVCILGFIIYSNTFTAPFVFDDIGTIYGNHALRRLNLLIEWWSPLKPRIVGYLTFLLNYKIAGWGVAVYHFTNLLIHIATTIFVWRLVLLIFKTPKLKDSEVSKHKESIAVFCALIFLTHPIQTQAVTYIVQRFASLATLFYVLSVFLYAKARIGKNVYYFAGAIVTMILGFLTKESAFTIPIMLIIFEFYFFGGLRKFLRPKFIALWILFLAVCTKFILLLVSTNDAFGPKTTFRGEEVTSANYLITQFGVFIKYIKLLTIPVGQSIDHYQPVIANVFEPSVIAGISLLLFLVILAIITFKKFSLLSFSIAWFLTTMSVESSFIPIKDLMFEHRLYLPMVGFSLFTSVIIYYIFRNKIPKKWPYILLVLIFIYGCMTFLRNNVWISKVSIWLDVVKRNPNNTRALTNLGSAYFKIKEFEQAQYYLDKSLSINPKNPDALVVKGTIYGERGQFDEALSMFDKALEIVPGHIGAYSNTGVVYFKLQKYEDAANAYKQIIKISPNNVPVYEILSYILTIGGKDNEAQEYVQKAIRLDPSLVNAYKNIESLKKSREEKRMELPGIID